MHKVSKRYGDVSALNEVSFTVQRGEVLALLGPNGAGKTTAISLMLGLRKPTGGVVRLFGMDPHSRLARARCGVMLQDSGVPMTLKVRELIELFRSYYPHPLPTTRLLEMVNLESKADAQAGTLSGGQRQRLYFALAACGDPEVIFLDEPTAALDVETRRSFWGHVREFASEGKTILFTTHYLEEADLLAKRIIIIGSGQIVADDTPAALKARIPGKQVSFDSPQMLDESAFRGLAIHRLDITSNHVTLLTNTPEQILYALFAAGVQISNLQVGGASLEEAVLNITAEKQKGA